MAAQELVDNAIELEKVGERRVFVVQGLPECGEYRFDSTSMTIRKVIVITKANEGKEGLEHHFSYRFGEITEFEVIQEGRRGGLVESSIDALKTSNGLKKAGIGAAAGLVTGGLGLAALGGAIGAGLEGSKVLDVVKVVCGEDTLVMRLPPEVIERFKIYIALNETPKADEKVGFDKQEKTLEALNYWYDNPAFLYVASIFLTTPVILLVAAVKSNKMTPLRRTIYTIIGGGFAIIICNALYQVATT